MSLYPRVSWWCGLRRLVYSCGWSWSRVGLRVPILCRVVDPAGWSWVGAGTETLCFADLFVRWFGRDMFQDVLIGPFWACVSSSSGSVLLGPVGRAFVSFCRRLVGWRAFRLSFVVVTHLCCRLVFLVYRVYVVCVFAQAAGCPRHVCVASWACGTWSGCLGCNVCVLPRDLVGLGRDLVRHLRRW